jgi:hypothetical protein
LSSPDSVLIEGLLSLGEAMNGEIEEGVAGAGVPALERGERREERGVIG